jgi:hypothetical protein
LKTTSPTRRSATTRSGSNGTSPPAIESTNSPWAMRSPNADREAQTASVCCGCQSPVSDAKPTTSASVTVRPRVVKACPASTSS